MTGFLSLHPLGSGLWRRIRRGSVASVRRVARPSATDPRRILVRKSAKHARCTRKSGHLACRLCYGDSGL